MSLVSTGAKHTLVLDESSFQQLLAAAFVVQQHNDGLRPADPSQATSGVLTEIAEIQSLVRSGGLDLHTAALLTAERLRKITAADGVRIELFGDAGLDNLAEAGTHIRSSAAAASVTALERLKQGELFQSSDTRDDVRLDPAISRQLNVRTLIAAPIASLTGFAGFIEAHWQHANACQENDARACSLMAGLVAGILERNAKSLDRVHAAESSGEILPQIPADTLPVHNFAFREPAAATAAIQETAATLEPAPSTHHSSSDQPELPTVTADLPSHCRVCGNAFEPDAAFCGNCSLPRVAGTPSENLQSKWASLWYMQQAKAAESRDRSYSAQPRLSPSTPHPLETTTPEAHATRPAITSTAPEGNRLWPLNGPQQNPSSEENSRGKKPGDPQSSESLASASSPTEAKDSAAADQSAQSTPAQHLSIRLRLRRPAAAWALPVVSLLLILFVLAVWPSSRNPQLTWFQSALVQLGLADAPVRTSMPTGNPAAQVWADVHTGLYYCDGSDLFGKTPDGHLATQHEAQQDQFEPAERTPCP